MTGGAETQYPDTHRAIGRVDRHGPTVDRPCRSVYFRLVESIEEGRIEASRRGLVQSPIRFARPWPPGENARRRDLGRRPTYLSQVEKGNVAPPTAERIKVMAELRDANADEWTALGRAQVDESTR